MVKQGTMEYLPNSPHVNSSGVALQMHKKLGRSVPSCNDQTGILPTALAPSKSSLGGLALVVPGQSEVGDLKNALVIDKEIRGFHISVEDAAVVEIFQAFEELEHVTLDLWLGKMD